MSGLSSLFVLLDGCKLDDLDSGCEARVVRVKLHRADVTGRLDDFSGVNACFVE